MRRVKKLSGALAVLFLLSVMSVPLVSAQELDGEWFKIHCHIKARQVDATTGEISHYGHNFWAYVHFKYWGTSSQNSPCEYRVYDVDAWVQNASGGWKQCHFGDTRTICKNDNFLMDLFLELSNGDFFFYTYSTPYISKDHSYFYAMGEVYDGMNRYGNEVYGGIIFCGHKACSLPFDPD